MSEHLAVAETKEEAIRQATATMEERRLREMRDEYARRARLWQACNDASERRAKALGLAKEDVVWFINNWVFGYDPRNAGTPFPAKVPFVLRPKQEEMVEWLEDLESDAQNGLIEKSRSEGATFVSLAYGLHHWLFVDGFSMAVGSRKLDLVDKSGNLDSLLPKFRYMLYNLPTWMQPHGFVPDEHDNFCRITNPKIESSIKGEAGANMGRGGRSTFYLVDEWAHVQQQQSVNAAIGDNARFHVKLSTPSGSQDMMQTEKHSGRYRVFRLHWQDNPVKNYTAKAGGEVIYPWYEKQKADKDPVSLAQEVDIDYGAAAENVVIPSKWVRAAVEMQASEGSVWRSGCDVGGTRDRTVYVHRRGPVVTRVKPIQVGERRQAGEVKQLCIEDETKVLYYDRMGVGSGITATLKRDEDELPFAVTGIANSDRPTNRTFADKPDVPADERFANYAAELWWALRIRFQATYERMEGIQDHPASDCISVPGDSALIAQLSQPTYSKNAKDKIKVDKTGGGNESPDVAEACMYAFAAEPQADWSTLRAVRANVQ